MPAPTPGILARVCTVYFTTVGETGVFPNGPTKLDRLRGIPNGINHFAIGLETEFDVKVPPNLLDGAADCDAVAKIIQKLLKVHVALWMTLPKRSRVNPAKPIASLDTRKLKSDFAAALTSEFRRRIPIQPNALKGLSTYHDVATKLLGKP